jgi:hypothetical protein
MLAIKAEEQTDQLMAQLSLVCPKLVCLVCLHRHIGTDTDNIDQPYLPCMHTSMRNNYIYI